MRSISLSKEFDNELVKFYYESVDITCQNS